MQEWLQNLTLMQIGWIALGVVVAIMFVWFLVVLTRVEVPAGAVPRADPVPPRSRMGGAVFFALMLVLVGVSAWFLHDRVPGPRTRVDIGDLNLGTPGASIVVDDQTYSTKLVGHMRSILATLRTESDRLIEEMRAKSRATEERLQAVEKRQYELGATHLEAEMNKLREELRQQHQAISDRAAAQEGRLANFPESSSD